MSKIALEPNASGTGTFTIASPNSNTSRTLTLPDTAGELLTDGSSLDAGNLTGTLPAIDGSALTGIESGGTTLLGTLSTASGASVTLSGLNLTGYKTVVFVGDAVRCNSAPQVLLIGAGRIYNVSYGGRFILFSAHLDLATGVVNAMGTGVYEGGTAEANYYNGLFPMSGQSGYSNTSTSLTVSLTANAFNSGSIKVYGVA